LYADSERTLTYNHPWYTQWRSNGGGGASRGTHPGAQALGAHQHTFCSHLKTRLKQKFIPKYCML